MRRASIYIYIISCIYIFYISNYKLYNWERKEGEYALAFHVYIRIVEMIYIYIYTYHGITNCIIVERGRKENASIHRIICLHCGNDIVYIYI